MKRITVKLGDLKPNPYKKHIQRGELDPAAIARIMESAERTSFWEQFVVRETASGYELAFGHNRLAAAKKLLGNDYKISVQLENYTDSQMFVAMADENAGDEETPARQVDVISKARQLLLANPKWCKALHHLSHGETDGRPQGGGHEHEHGSVNCILAYLGEENWSRAKIGRLLMLGERVDKSILTNTLSLQDSRDGHQFRPGEISQSAAVALSKLEKPVQRVAAQALREAEIAIPAREVAKVVEKVKDLPPAKQEAAVVREIERKEKIELGKEAREQQPPAPKAKNAVPDVGVIFENLAIQVSGITETLKEILPFKDVIRTNPSFKNLDKKILTLAAVMVELGTKSPLPARAAECNKQLNQ